MAHQKTRSFPRRRRQSTSSSYPEAEMRHYFSELSKTALLTAEEERDLGRLVQAGNTKAFQKLIAANLRLVVKIAMQYYTSPSQMMDLIQEGNLGLARAAQHFDPERGIRFAPYAIWWIRAGILRMILDQHRLVRLGTTATQRKIFFQLDKVRARLSAVEGEVSDERVAEEMGVKVEEVRQLKTRMHRPEASLDTPQGEEGRPLSDLLAAANTSPEDDAIRQDLREMVQEALTHHNVAPTEREKAILNERLLSDDPLTLDELGVRFGVSRERIRQLEKALLGQLKRHLLTKLHPREHSDFLAKEAA